ncbi:Superkiller viralicidic activity 2 2 [Fasciola hepatica]|uniref:Superkiller viralicidic activity 2 2 n=1 Tax=Fasciola hepatica TaxID=6192 RepID=A0A4E0RN38_FASHE|nr:Superkiller viralicidic activity 2 2 [Fasciola hepatica]
MHARACNKIISRVKSSISWPFWFSESSAMNTWDIDLEGLASSFVPKSQSSCLDNSTIPGKRVYEAEPLDALTKRKKKQGPKFETYTLNSGEGCLHEVVYPAGVPLKPLSPITEPAREYPFALDSFQREAVTCIENGQSVLVAAHTSAGKTVVAEYAVARCLKRKQRVIYTTPIKALSNQKFREFTEEFKDVGLMTGDITINPSATVLIMTTEILLSMLYRGSEVTREVGWVIFDEIHYMREKERGVVWEETIILLPDIVGLVFLSATIPNARQFAEWVVFLHKQPCHVVYTEYRPVPLQHYLFPCGGDGARPYCAKLVKLVMDQNLEPLIVFSFSKVDCEFYATQMNKMDFNTDTEKAAVDLIFNNAIASLSAEDKRLPQVQILLPVLRRGVGIHHGGLLPILKEIVEILFAEGLIKVLYATETFAMGLNMPARTVLFTATRKFDGRNFRLVSSGEYIQMSGRAGRRGKDDRGTVILMLDDQISATDVRQLLSGQPDRLDSAFYLTNNMVLNLLRVEDINPELMLEKSFLQFQTKSMMPSLHGRIKALESEIKTIHFPDDIDLEKLGALVRLREAKLSTERERWAVVLKAKSVVPFLQVGRVLRVHTMDDVDFGWAVLLHVEQPQTTAIRGQKVESAGGLLLHCLLETLPLGMMGEEDTIGGSDTKLSSVPLSMVEPAQSAFHSPDLDDVPMDASIRTVVHVVTVPLACIAELSSVCLKVRSVLTDSTSGSGSQAGKSADVVRRVIRLSESIRRHLWEGIQRAQDQLGGELPLLDPIRDMHISDPKLKQLAEMAHMLDARIELNPISKRTDAETLIDLFAHRANKLHELKVLQKHLESRDSLVQLDELYARKRLLRRLGFCLEDDVIAFKGRIACEISSGDELMLTELMLDGLFSNLNAPQLAGVLSCFVVEHNASKADKVVLQPDMEGALKQIQAKARFLARAAAECRVGGSRAQKDEPDAKATSAVPEAGALLNSRVGILDDEQAYVDRFSGELMEVVRAWALGVSFARLCELTHVFEGSVIRCMRRLEELLRQMHDAAKVAGNSELENKFVQGGFQTLDCLVKPRHH